MYEKYQPNIIHVSSALESSRAYERRNAYAVTHIIRELGDDRAGLSASRERAYFAMISLGASPESKAPFPPCARVV